MPDQAEVALDGDARAWRQSRISRTCDSAPAADSDRGAPSYPFRRAREPWYTTAANKISPEEATRRTPDEADYKRRFAPEIPEDRRGRRRHGGSGHGGHAAGVTARRP